MASDPAVLASLHRQYRRSALTIRRGRVNIVDDTGAVQKIQLTISADELRDNTPKLAVYGFCSNPLPGADAVIAYVGGDQSNGVVIATGDQRYRLLNLRPGESGMHDNLGQKIYLSQAGIEITSPGTSTSGNLVAGTGASGSFTTPTGQIVTVQNGIITNIY